jgi:hypothetical protein
MNLNMGKLFKRRSLPRKKQYETLHTNLFVDGSAVFRAGGAGCFRGINSAKAAIAKPDLRANSKFLQR